MLLKFIEDAGIATVLQRCARILLKALDSTLPACVQRSLSTRPSDAVRGKIAAILPLIAQVRANQSANEHAAVSNRRHRFIAHGVQVTAPLGFLPVNNASPIRFTFATRDANRVLRVL